MAHFRFEEPNAQIKTMVSPYAYAIGCKLFVVKKTSRLVVLVINTDGVIKANKIVTDSTKPRVVLRYFIFVSIALHFAAFLIAARVY